MIPHRRFDNGSRFEYIDGKKRQVYGLHHCVCGDARLSVRRVEG